MVPHLRDGRSSAVLRLASAVAALALALTVSVTGSLPPQQASAATTDSLPGTMVWAHMIPHGLPDYTERGASPYGDQFPLDLIPGDWEAAPRPTSGVPRARQAGLNGMQIFQIEGVNKGTDFVDSWMKEADPLWADTDPKNNFAIAPCLLVWTPDGAVRMIKEYVAGIPGHRSAARSSQGRPIVFVYAIRSMAASDWATVRSKLAAAGISVFLLGDIQSDSSQHGNQIPTSLIDPFLPSFDAFWMFDDGAETVFRQANAYLSGKGKTFIGGVIPGYNRETSADGGFVDARATKSFRNLWHQHLDAALRWVNIVSWNDTVEHHDIKANSNWNITRQDINAFFGAKLRGEAFPKPRPELYATTPTFGVVGQSVEAEGLVLNGGSAPVQVTTRLLDASGATLATATATVAPGADGDATPRWTVPSGAANTTVWAETTTTTAAGAIVQSVRSAPIVLYTSADVTASQLRRGYYSIPAAKALPAGVRIALTNRQAVATGGATATVTSDLGTAARFVDVLQNTREAARGYDVRSVSAAVSIGQRTISGGQVVKPAAQGFYVGRVIDGDERVGYSLPVRPDQADAPTAPLPGVVVTAPRYDIEAGPARAAQVSWAPVAAASGLQYDVEVRPITVAADGTRTAGAATPWLTATVARSQTYAGASGATVEFRARARSSDGRLGAWSSWTRTSFACDERECGTWGGRWVSVQGNDTYLRTSRASHTTGPTWSYGPQWTDQVRLYGSVGPRGGKAALYVDGAYVTTVDTYAPTVGRRRLLATANVAWGRHGFRLLAQGTTARPEVVVDAVVLGR